MGFNIKIKIEHISRGGIVHTEIDKKKLEWNWEFGTGKYVAFIKVPDPAEWETLFNSPKYERDKILSIVAEEVCHQKFNNCTFNIADDMIEIY
jgi:hypothetical protein